MANFATEVEYGNAVEWLISQDVDIISCSVGWPTGGPGDGTGTICQIVDTAKVAGILWAQSIGNQAQKHWQGDFSNPDADYFHNFSGADEGNIISAIDGQPIVVALKWDDTWGASVNDYDLLLYDNNDNLVAFSLNIQDGDDDPWESLAYTANYTGTYDIVIGMLGSPATVNFHLYSYYHDLEYQTNSGSFTVPADSFSAVAVGAVDYSTPDTLESFSSRGPTDDGRVKPDLVATDNVSTVSYGATAFSGTSASAPHAAGAAALVQERFPSYTPNQIKSFLEGRAVDLGSAGKDNLYGSGRLHLGNSGNYTLTMAVSGSGNVTPTAGTHTYAEGTLVSINATPASGWQFSKWTGDVANANSATTTVTMDDDKTITAVFTQIAAPPSGGGGGGGGGGSVAGLTSLSPVTTMEGKIIEDITALSGDKKVILSLPKGTMVKNRVGSLLPNILIKEEKEPPAPSVSSEFVGLVYDIGPDRATFDPPITLAFEYDASELPKGVDERNLVIATWDESKEQWIKMESTVDPENDIVSVNVAHLCYFTIMAGTRPAEFNISNLSVTPSEIYPGENANISIIVTNIGDLTGNYEAILKINDEVKETRGITIAGGDNVTADFIVTGGTIEKYIIEIGGLEAIFNAVQAPSIFTVSSLTISSDEVAIGEEVDISVVVTNTSESAGNYEVILKINGTIVDTKEVTLPGIASEEVVFTTTMNTAGKKIIDINGLLGSLVVKGEVPSPAQIPLPLEETEPIPEPETEITPSVPTETSSVEPLPTSEYNRWLIGIIIACCVIVAALLLYFTWWQKRSVSKSS